MPVSPLPLSPALVSGLLNLRGEVLPVIDGAHLLGREGYREDEKPGLLIFVEPQFALLVDRIGDVTNAPDELIIPSPGNLSDAVKEVVQSVYKRSRDLMMVLNIEKVYQQMLVEAEAWYWYWRW